MCGRGRCALSAEQIKQAGKVVTVDNNKVEDVKPTENFSPGMVSSVIISRAVDEEREIQQMIFGLIPHFMSPKEKPNHYTMFNARIETVTEKPSFKNLIGKGKRCLVLFSGFYEWKTDNKIKQPHYVYLAKDPDEENVRNKRIKHENENENENEKNEQFVKDEFNEEDSSIMRIAGLYDDWTDSDGKTKRTYTILTCPSCSGFRWLHSRQPVFLTEKLIDDWLNPKCDIPSTLETLQSDLHKEKFSNIIKAHPVTKKMGIASYQEKDCHKKLEIVVSKYKSAKSISSYYSTSSESPNKKVQVSSVEFKSPSSSSSHLNNIQTFPEELNKMQKRKFDFGEEYHEDKNISESITVMEQKVEKSVEDFSEINVKSNIVNDDYGSISCDSKMKDSLTGKEEIEQIRKTNQFSIDVTEDNGDDNDLIEYEKGDNPMISHENELSEHFEVSEVFLDTNSESEITESNDFFQNCFICHADISIFSETAKENHINNCCQKLDNRNVLTPTKTPKMISSQSSSQSNETKKGKKRTIENYFISNTTKN